MIERPCLVKRNTFSLFLETILTPFRQFGLLTECCLNQSFACLTCGKDHWLALQRHGTAALDANQYWIAEPALKQAMMEAEKTHPPDLRLAESLGELGRLCTIRGRFDEAESYLEEELNTKEEVYGADYSQCIPAMGSLIQFYLVYGTKRKATPLTIELLAFVEGKMGEMSAGSVQSKLKRASPYNAGWALLIQPYEIQPLNGQLPVTQWAIVIKQPVILNSQIDFSKLP